MNSFSGLLLLWILAGQAAAPAKGDPPEIQARRVKVDELGRRVIAEIKAAKAIQEGPCLCGAPSHQACKTREACDPVEEKAMAGHRAAALAAKKEREGLLRFLSLYDEIGRELDLRANQAAHLTGLKEKLACILRKNQEKQNWRQELDDWVQESQDAQAGAVKACVKLLIGPLGPIEQSIKAHADAGEKFLKAYENNKPRLEQAVRAIRSAATGKAGSAVNEFSRLNAIEQTLTRHIADEKNPLQLLTWTKELAENILLATDLLEKGAIVVDAAKRQSIGAALETAQKIVREMLVDYFADKSSVVLSETPYARYASGFQLARWGFDYGFEAYRFYTAWSHINDVLADIDRDQAVLKKLGDQLTAAQDRLSALRAESQALEAARGTTVEQMERAILDARKP